MKIDFFRHSLLSRGGDKMIVVHANHLASIGHEVRIVAAIIDTVFTIDSRISVIELPRKNKLSTIFSALTSKFDSDLVIADIIAMVCFLSIRNRSKLICFAQDYDESYYTSIFQKGLIRCFYYFGLKIFRIPAIAVSYPLAELLEKRFSARVTVAENGVDTRVFYPEPDSDLIAAKGRRLAIILLSRSDQRKGFDIAQEVMKQLSKAHSDLFEVWTVGEPAAGLFSGSVHRDFGYVGEEKLRRILSSADLFFYPTRHEGFPLMPLESLACGCPVVTTKAVPYGDSEVAIKLAEIGDSWAMERILQEFLEFENLLAESKRSCINVAGRYSLTSCLYRFEASLMKGFG